MLPRRPSAVPASPPGTSPRTSSDTLSQCACKLRVSGDQLSRCCSVMSPRPQRVPTFRPTSSSSSGRSTALPRPAPAGAGTQPKTSCSRSSRPCDYAELRGQATTPASGNTPARPEPRHNGSIGIIVGRNPQVMGEPEIVIGAVAHPGRQRVPLSLQLAAAGGVQDDPGIRRVAEPAAVLVQDFL